MTKEQIQKVLLESVGNPTVGPIKAASEKMAEAVFDALNPEVKETKKTYKVEKENRVIESEETR